MNRTTDLTDGERMLLLTLMEPFVFMPDGLLQPLSAERVAALWWTETAHALARTPEPA